MQKVGEPYRGTLRQESDQAAAGGARLGAGAEGARQMVRSGVVKVTRTSSRAGARVAVREAFGSAARPARMPSEIERCALATLSMRSRQAEASEASTGVGAPPINTAAHAAARVPRTRTTPRPATRSSSEKAGTA